MDCESNMRPLPFLINIQKEKKTNEQSIWLHTPDNFLLSSIHEQLKTQALHAETKHTHSCPSHLYHLSIEKRQQKGSSSVGSAGRVRWPNEKACMFA